MKTATIFTLAVSMFICSCNDQATSRTETSEPEITLPDIKEEPVGYNLGDSSYTGYVVYDHNLKGKRPAILVVHEWWGVGDYTRSRAKQLAELGYIAMAVDMFGNGRTAADPAEAQTLATPFYENPQLTKDKLDAAIVKLLSYPEADSSKLGAIGYCFGGYVVLNAAKLGTDFKGVVSFHGSLGGVAPKKELLKAKILICHGAADNFVPAQEVDAFKSAMDSASANYVFKVYPDATHAFTNPDATEVGQKFKMPIQYNAAADSASWNDMKAFFKTVF